MKLLLSGLALLFLGIACFGAHLAIEQADRVAVFSLPTTATILETRLELRRHTHVGGRRTPTGPQYLPVVKFAYEVDGQEYNASTIFPDEFAIGGNLGRKIAKAPLDRFEVGQTTVAYASSENPAEACLIRQPRVIPYLIALLPMFGLSIVTIFWSSSSAGHANFKRTKARRLALIWHAFGLAALLHYLSVARSDYGGAALALFGLYTQLGLIPIVIGLPPAKSAPWATQVEGAIVGSAIGSFAGLWLGLGIGMIVPMVSDTSMSMLQWWGYTIISLVVLGGIGGWIVKLVQPRETGEPQYQQPS